MSYRHRNFLTDHSPSGVLYGVAGLAHLFDLLIGDSVLFASAGIPPYTSLSSSAQAFALLWCASGPLAYTLNRIDSQSNDRAQSISQSNDRAGVCLSDLGLVLYGLIEVAGAALAVNASGGDVLMKAVGVQGVVLASWLYSKYKQISPVKPSPVK